MDRLKLSIVIPTYGRDEVLCDTIVALLELDETADEILVVDQTAQHKSEVIDRLKSWNEQGTIRWIQRRNPSITESMNAGLRLARGHVVLFLDDDIIPGKKLVSKHREAHKMQPSLWATVGQVIQPWQQPADLKSPKVLKGLRRDFDFPFHSTHTLEVTNVMAGNLCVHRARALSIEGFDENFQGSAFRFETEFARRVIAAGGTIQFIGSAGIHHLRVPSGGTRKEGSHLTSADPRHGLGDHYYAFLHGEKTEALHYACSRVLREVRTRFHLLHPWWIPVKLAGELRAMWRGWRMAARKKREARSENRLGTRDDR